MSSLEILLKDDVRLPSPPAIAVRILDLVKHDNFSFRQLGEIIQADPALTSRILRLANSSCYAMPKQISNFETAVAMLGGNTLKNIALSFIISQRFHGKRGDKFDFGLLWRRSVTSAVAGQLLASEIGLKSDDVFITALLQDIGIGAMFLCRREDYLAVLDEKAVSGHLLSSVERGIFGFDHQQAGSSLLKMWGLPESVYLPILHHHEPENAPLAVRPLCQIIQASDQLSAVYYGSGSVKNARRVKDLLGKQFQMDEGRAMQLVDAVAQKSDEVLSQFNIQPENTPSYSEILQKANEELIRLNISSQTLVIEYREAKQRADKLAAELKVANDKLRSVACRDDLTGLYNHRFFRESLGSELEFAERNRLSVSVIMFDIDNFKGINDSYGHHCGDLALQAVGNYLLQTSRASDIAARYGGDEFIILLRDTPLEGARVRAETICDELSSVPVDCNGVQLGITASFGVAAYDPRVPMTRSELANLVDKAMYESKSKGRNRVSVQRGIA